MSRIGRMPVLIPKSVSVTLSDGVLSAKGPRGELAQKLVYPVTAEIKDGHVFLSADLKAVHNASALYGMSRARVNNLLLGVSAGFSKVLDIVGIGFRAEAAGQKLTMTLGKSHPVVFEVPNGVAVAVDPKKTQITLSGADKDLVGETAAMIRALRRPEPYKGTGIRYQGERVRRKAGKTAAGAGAGAGGAKK